MIRGLEFPINQPCWRHCEQLKMLEFRVGCMGWEAAVQASWFGAHSGVLILAHYCEGQVQVEISGRVRRLLQLSFKGITKKSIPTVVDREEVWSTSEANRYQKSEECPGLTL